jgi:hypothetical protein
MRRRGPFERNAAAVRSPRPERRASSTFLDRRGRESNKEIARRLGISPYNRQDAPRAVFEKLAVQRRVQAVEKARLAALIP